MNLKSPVALLAASLLATSAWAQTTGKALNLKLPPSDVPAVSATAAPPARPAPGVYYGDTSGRLGTRDTGDAVACDDASYDKAQVHGSVSTGIFTGSHLGTGTYDSGNVNITKNLGSCDDPKGGVSMSISVGTSHLNGRGYRGYGHGGY